MTAPPPAGASNPAGAGVAKRKAPNVDETWRKVQETNRRLEDTVHRIEAQVKRTERNSESVHGKVKATKSGVVRTERNLGMRPKRRTA